jgi:hypothetical protein
VQLHLNFTIENNIIKGIKELYDIKEKSIGKIILKSFNENLNYVGQVNRNLLPNLYIYIYIYITYYNQILVIRCHVYLNRLLNVMKFIKIIYYNDYNYNNNYNNNNNLLKVYRH